MVRELGRWEVARWLIHVPHPYGEADGRAWFETVVREAADRSHLHLVLWPKEGGTEIVGGMGLVLHAHGTGRAELGYWLAPSVWGRGLATEAARAMVACGFRDLGLTSVEAAVDPANGASNRVMEKTGLKLTGVEPLHDKALRGPPGPANIWRLGREAWFRRQGGRE